MSALLRVTDSRLLTAGPGLVLELRDPTGRVGRGEAAPLPGYSPDSVAECRDALEPFLDSPLALPLEADPIAAIGERVATIPARCPAARCAADCALLDLAGQLLDRPVWQLLGGRAGTRIEANALVDSMAAARAALAGGFTTLKLKVGRRPWPEELELLRRLRGELGDSVALRLDANRRWSVDQARAALADLAALAPEFVEEPVAAGDLPRLGPSPVPLAVDESLSGELPDLTALGRHGVVAAVLKPMLLGGLLRCRELADAARRSGLDPVVGHMNGGPIELRAATELALALAPRRACGLARHRHLCDWPRRVTPRVGTAHPRAELHSGLGLTTRLSLLEAAAEQPDRIALMIGSRSHRCAELVAPVTATLAWLAARGITGAAGDRVGVVAHPTLDTAVLLYALFELGATAVLLDPRLPPEERRLRQDRAGVTLRLGDPWRIPAHVDPTGPPPRRPDSRDDQRILSVVFTSASSGEAKPVELSRAAWVAAADASAANLGWRDDDRWLVCLPLAHVGGLAILIRCLVDRRTAVIAGGFEVARVIDTVATSRITLLSLVPTMLDRLLEADWRPPNALRAVVLGGAAAPRALVDAARRRGLPILTSYGMTETCGQIATLRPSDALDPARTSVGPALPGVEIGIADDGTILVRTPSLMSGYGPGSVVPPAVDADDWLVTGDRGWLDPAGELHVAGRRDATIVTGGDNVHPEPVEEVLRGYPGIRDVCVFGLPDPRWGEIVAAALVGDPVVDRGALDHYLRERLAGYQCPRRLLWLPALPLGSSGKVDRAALIAAAHGRDQTVIP